MAKPPPFAMKAGKGKAPAAAPKRKAPPPLPPAPVQTPPVAAAAPPAAPPSPIGGGMGFSRGGKVGKKGRGKK